MGHKFQNILETIGRTPVVRLNRIAPDGINLVQANGPGAGQSVLHFHIHVFPRAEDDGAMLNWGFEAGDMDRITAHAETIRAALG